MVSMRLIFLGVIWVFAAGNCFAQNYDLSPAESRLVEEKDVDLIRRHVENIFLQPISKSLNRIFIHEFDGQRSYFDPIPFRVPKIAGHNVDSQYMMQLQLPLRSSIATIPTSWNITKIEGF